MTQNISQVSNWFVTDNDRDRALIKYELNSLKSALRKQLEGSSKLKYCSSKVILLCGSLANKYLDYLQLLDHKTGVQISECSAVTLDWPKHFNRILNLEQKLVSTLVIDEAKELLVEIIFLYQQVKHAESSASSKQVHEHSNQLRQLFSTHHLNSWLMGLVEFWNQYHVTCVELAILFRDWNAQQQQYALDFFANSKFVDLVNAIFFYKLYPDKLFNKLIHPEKLVSVRMRLGVLHYYIELMQQQLYSAALQNGLMPGIDYFLHGEELPEGIMIEANENFREIIQRVIKKMQVGFNPENIKQVTLERLHDLERAYKFWFNPSRLIDAVMVLQQSLVSEPVERQSGLTIFQDKMVSLYRQLTTIECLDLYGYFANNDTRYLLYTLFAIQQGIIFDWLPSLNEEEKKTAINVFDALYCVMEALRIELKNRHVTTTPYVYDLAKSCINVGHRNRDAVLRAIAIYGSRNVTLSDTVEELFRFVGEN